MSSGDTLLESSRAKKSPAKIVLAGEERELHWKSGESILITALRNGVAFPYECSSGQCGACQYRLLEGEVEVAWPEAPGWTARARKKGDRFLGCQSRPAGNIAIEVRQDPDCLLPHLPKRFAARIVSKRKLSSDMWEFTLRAHEAAKFLPGQYCLVEVPRIAGTRAFSMSNLPSDGGVWTFVIKQKPGGAQTTWLAMSASEGDDCILTGPLGKACLRQEHTGPIVCIVGGSGLAPAISIARGAIEANAERQVEIFYGARGVADMVDLPALLGPCSTSSRLSLVTALSQDVPSGWSGKTGFIHHHAAKCELLGEADIFVAGPNPMVEATMAMLSDQDVNPDRIHFDSFY